MLQRRMRHRWRFSEDADGCRRRGGARPNPLPRVRIWRTSAWRQKPLTRLAKPGKSGDTRPLVSAHDVDVTCLRCVHESYLTISLQRHGGIASCEPDICLDHSGDQWSVCRPQVLALAKAFRLYREGWRFLRQLRSSLGPKAARQLPARFSQSSRSTAPTVIPDTTRRRSIVNDANLINRKTIRWISPVFHEGSIARRWHAEMPDEGSGEMAGGSKTGR